MQAGKRSILFLLLALGLVVARPAVAQAGESARERLARGVAGILARDEVRHAEVGIEVRTVPDGDLVYEHAADRPLIPASNQKLITLAMALCLFGEDHQFETPVIGAGAVDQKGVLHGDLWVVGCGDPTLQARYLEQEDPQAALEPFVDALVRRGLTGVTGALVVDDRAFDDEWVAPGWPADQLNRDYCAPVGALSLAGNCVDVLVTGRPGRPALLELRPPLRRIHLVGGTSSSPRSTELLVDLQRPEGDGDLRVRGKVGGATGTARLEVPVRDPGLYFGDALVQALAGRGVRVAGGLRRPEAGEEAPENAPVLFRRHGPLRTAVAVCGKESDNGVAEHLWKACGAAQSGQGTFASGAAAARSFLAGLGVPLAGVELVDGSGLSRENKVTAGLLAGLLVAMYRAPERDTYLRSLPICGVDGTLSRRMEETAMLYRVRAKTGYLRGVSCLSGYAMSGSREEPRVYAFSIVVNEMGSAALRDVQRAQDDVCRLLVDLGP